MRQLPLTTEYSTCPWCKKGTLQYVAESPKADTYACDSCGKAVWWRGLDKKPRKIQYLKYPAMIRNDGKVNGGVKEKEWLEYIQWKNLSEQQKTLLRQIIELEKQGKKIIFVKPPMIAGKFLVFEELSKYIKRKGYIKMIICILKNRLKQNVNLPKTKK